MEQLEPAPGPIGVKSLTVRRVSGIASRGTQSPAKNIIGKKTIDPRPGATLLVRAPARIFGKLGLAPSDDDNRRVLAVLAYLNAARS